MQLSEVSQISLPHMYSMISDVVLSGFSNPVSLIIVILSVIFGMFVWLTVISTPLPQAIRNRDTASSMMIDTHSLLLMNEILRVFVFKCFLME